MIKLPKKFIANNTDVDYGPYTVTATGNDMFKIEWNNSRGSGSVLYRTDEVMNLFNEGDWYIAEVLEPYLPDNFVFIVQHNGTEYICELEGDSYRVSDMDREHSVLYEEGYMMDVLMENFKEGTWVVVRELEPEVALDTEADEASDIPSSFKFTLSNTDEYGDDREFGDTSLVHEATVDGDKVHVKWHPKHAELLEGYGGGYFTTTALHHVKGWVAEGSWTVLTEEEATQKSFKFTNSRGDGCEAYYIGHDAYHVYNNTNGSDILLKSFIVERCLNEGLWTVVKEETEDVKTDFSTRLAYFQTHIDAVKENLESLQKAFDELKREAV